jgi:hypothetical protein
MQEVVDHWEGGLRATGGAIVPSKSYWYLLDYKWTGHKWKYRKKADMSGKIDIRSINGQSQVPLQRFEPDHAKETLGVFLAMNGNNKEEIKKLRAKSVEFSECIRTGRLTRFDAWYALTSTVMKTLEYLMAATTIKEKEWNSIMSPLMAEALPAAGINRKFPQQLLYAPLKYQGLGIIHPYYRQELVHITEILRESSMTSITGELMRAAMEQLCLEIGLGGVLREWSYPSYGQNATSCWLQTVWKFCSQHDLFIHDKCPQLQRARQNDHFLMDVFLAHGYTGNNLKMLNNCRMWLKTITTADVTTADGKYLTLDSWNGKRIDSRCHNYQWPRLQDRLVTDTGSFGKRLLIKALPLTRHNPIVNLGFR